MNIKNLPNNFTFIIPTLSNRDGLLNVLKKIDRIYPKSSVVIVNNNQEGFEPTERYKFKLEVLEQGRNTGFAKAVNDGALRGGEKFNPKYFVFLNDDVDFSGDWVGECIRVLERNKWAAASALLKNKSGQIENAGYRVLKYGKVELNKNIRQQVGIDGVSAAALVFRSVEFFALKGFDEKFFAYLEDVDLFLRAEKMNLKFGVVKDAVVYHEGQTTSSRFQTKKAWLDFRNWIRVINKNWSREDLKRFWFQILVERGRNLFGVIKALF